MPRILAAIVGASALAGCGAAPPSAIPIPIGPGRAYTPPSLSPAVARAGALGALRCARLRGARFGVYVELLAYRRVVLIPAGVGIAPPRRAAGAYVYGGRCYYPVITREPTGVIEVRAGVRAVLGDLFALWGQPLSRTALAGFRAPVHVYIDGRPVGIEPRSIPLRRHATIVVELGGYVPPHSSYTFPPGL